LTEYLIRKQRAGLPCPAIVSFTAETQREVFLEFLRDSLVIGYRAEP